MWTPQRPVGLVDDPEHPHVGKSDQQLAHARRVQLHRGSPGLDDLDSRQVRRAPVSRPGSPTPRSFPKSHFTIGRGYPKEFTPLEEHKEGRGYQIIKLGVNETGAGTCVS